MEGENDVVGAQSRRGGSGILVAEATAVFRLFRLHYVWFSKAFKRQEQE